MSIPKNQNESHEKVSLTEDYWLDPIYNVKTAVFNVKEGASRRVDVDIMKRSLEGVISVDEGRENRIIVNYCPDETLADKILGDIRKFFFA